MATTKKSRPATRRKTTTSNSEPGTKTTTNRSSARSGGPSQKRSSASAKRTTSAKRPASAKRTTSARRTASPGTSASRNGASQNASRQNGSAASASNGLAGSLKSMSGTVVHGMDRAAKPALAVGATAAGIAGGIALRRRQKSTLPFGLPRNGDIDIIAISKAVGKASARLGQTAKSVSKDIDTAADRAERIGKILS